VVVEVPPPNVIVRPAAAPVCAEGDCWFRRCCHFHRCAPVYVQPVIPAYSAPAMAPVAVQPFSYAPAPVAAPVAVQPFSYAPAPVAAPVAVQPLSVAPAAPVAAPVAIQPLSLSVAPSAPVALQSLSLSVAPTAPVAAPQSVNLVLPVHAAPAAPTAPTAPEGPGMDCNQALRKVTSQIETLTKVVDKHNDYLKSHEKRLQRLEDYLSKTENLKKPLPPLEDKDH
jgi:hypothetical protein